MAERPGDRLVRLERHGEGGHVVELVLDRPSAMNAISTAMAEALAAATGELAADDQVRCVVLTSSHDRAFCVGADLKERDAFSDADLVQQRPIARGGYGGVLDLPMPTVAAVDGFALGNAWELGDLANPGLQEPGRTVALVDIGAVKTSINILRDNIT